MANIIEGDLVATKLKIGIVAARFNSFVVEPLLQGAIDTVVRHGGSSDNITIVRVPGSFEIPLACKKLAESGSYDALIAVGAIIRGATTHYELVCNEAQRGVGAVISEFGIPVGFGIITTDTLEQAIERAGSKAGNKGADAAIAAIEMATLIKKIKA